MQTTERDIALCSPSLAGSRRCHSQSFCLLSHSHDTRKGIPARGTQIPKEHGGIPISSPYLSPYQGHLTFNNHSCLWRLLLSALVYPHSLGSACSFFLFPYLLLQASQKILVYRAMDSHQFKRWHMQTFTVSLALSPLVLWLFCQRWTLYSKLFVVQNKAAMQIIESQMN